MFSPRKNNNLNKSCVFKNKKNIEIEIDEVPEINKKSVNPKPNSNFYNICSSISTTPVSLPSTTTSICKSPLKKHIDINQELSN